jgi:hypothetical protein
MCVGPLVHAPGSNGLLLPQSFLVQTFQSIVVVNPHPPPTAFLNQAQLCGPRSLRPWPRCSCWARPPLQAREAAAAVGECCWIETNEMQISPPTPKTWGASRLIHTYTHRRLVQADAGMATTPTTLLPRPSLATIDDGAPAVSFASSAWRAPARRLNNPNDAYDMGGPLPICWWVT